jgi:hypothetical protein
VNARGWWLLAVVVLAILVGCDAGTGAPEPAESVPPAPDAPAGWQSIVTFGSSGPGVGAMAFDVAEGAVAVHASCVGADTLIVTLTTSGPSAEQAIAAPAAVFRCGGAGEPATSRVELEGVSVGEVSATAYLVEGPGTTRHGAFNVSIEQPAGAASN